MGSNKSLIQNVGKEALLYLPSNLIPALIGFIGLSVYTRLFTPEEYGTYSLIITTIGFIGTFTYSWLNQSNLRFFIKYKKEHLRAFISTSFFILAACLLFGSIIIIISKNTLGIRLSGESLLCIILYLVSTGVLETILTILRANRNPKNISLIRCSSSIFYLVLSLPLIYVLNLRIYAVFLSTAIINFIIIIYEVLRYKVKEQIKFNSFSFKMMKEFIYYGIPLSITLIFSWILVASDRYLIHIYKGNMEVGIYSATYNLASYPTSLLSSIVIMAAFPIIIESWEKNSQEETQLLITKIVRYYLIIAIPSLIGITVLCKEIMSIIGPSYSEGYRLMPWICFGSIVSGLCTYVNKGFELKKDTKTLSLIVGFAGISNVFMNLLLIPKYGYYGAGIATSLSYMIYLLMGTHFSKKRLDWKFIISIRSTVNIIICSVIMGGVIKYVEIYYVDSVLDILLLITLGIVIYLFLLSLTNEIKEELVFIHRNLMWL